MMRMHILTDCSNQVPLPDGTTTEWKPAQGSFGNEAEQLVWRALAQDKPVVLGSPAPSPIADPAPIMAFVSEASQSQFDALLALTQEHPDLPDVMAQALTGKQFHGYRGRPWRALAGNIHLSASFSMNPADAGRGEQLAAVPALAVLDAVEEVYGPQDDLGIKWINDIEWRGRKVAGVLSSARLRGGRPVRVTFGIGVNVEVAPRPEPTLFVPEAGCLNNRAGEETFSWGALFWPLCSALRKRFRQWTDWESEGLVRDYQNRSTVIGKQVRVWPSTVNDSKEDLRRVPPLVTGRVRGMNDDLALLIDGVERPVVQGRLAYEEVCRRRGL